MRGIRARLTVTLVALVALTAVLLGAGAYLFVDNEPARAGPRRRRRPRRGFDLSVIDPEPRPAARPDAPRTSSTAGCARRSCQRGVDTIIDVGAGGPVVSRAGPRRRPADAPGRPPRRASTRASSPTPGSTLAGRPSLVVGGRRRRQRAGLLLRPRRAVARGGARPAPDSRSSSGRSSSSSLALLVARVIARGVLAPVEAAGRAAERIERRRPVGARAGHLERRVRRRGPSGSTGWPRRWPTRSAGSRPPRPRTGASSPTWPTSCGRRSRRSSPRPRSCASTSTTLPAESRRAGELLVADVGRLRDARRRPDGGLAVRRRRRADRASSRSTWAASSGRSPRPGCRRRRSHLPDRAARHRHRPAPARADPRQPARQRPRARRRARRSRSRCRPTPARSCSRSPIAAGRPARPARAHLRALLQGRPVAPRREQRAGPGDRRRARRAARRLPHGREPRRAAACASSSGCL